MKSTIGNEPYLGVVSPMRSPLEAYEELELRAEFRVALGRSRLRSALGRLIAGLCGLYERMGLGRPALRLLAAPAAPAAPPTIGIDEVAGAIDPSGRPVAGPPRLSRRDYEAWAKAYVEVRENGLGPVGGRFVNGGFYLDSGRSLAIRVEAARALGYEALRVAAAPRSSAATRAADAPQVADCPSSLEPAIMAS